MRKYFLALKIPRWNLAVGPKATASASKTPIAVAKHGVEPRIEHRFVRTLLPYAALPGVRGLGGTVGRTGRMALTAVVWEGQRRLIRAVFSFLHSPMVVQSLPPSREQLRHVLSQMKHHPFKLAQYREIVVLTGAGVSVASGLQTYRGQGGLWEEVDVEANATAEALASDPVRVWSFFAELRLAVANARPNPAHQALAEAEARLPATSRLTVITQNVDGLHSAAGSRRVVELHGSLHRSRCVACNFARPEVLAESSPDCPVCPQCGEPLRPDVVLFGEQLPAAQEWESKKVLRDCDIFIAVGTSGSVSPASNFVRSAKYAGARTVYINPEPMVPVNPAFDETLLGKAEEVLPLVFESDF